MNKKRLVHFINSIQLSHILCIAFGALVPIYADVLLLHGYDSSTTSAIMDTVMAIIALITVFKVYRWLDSKLNDKGFEQANLYIVHFIEAKTKAEILHVNINAMFEFMSGKDLNEVETEYQTRNTKIEELHSDYRDHMLKLKSQLDILKVWDIEVHPDKRDELDQCLENLHAFTITSRKLINAYKDVNQMAREKQWRFYDIDFKHNLALVSVLSSVWLTSWRKLFKVSESTTAN